MAYLIYGGKTGWIGQKLTKMLEEQGKTVHAAVGRMEDRTAVEKDLDEFKPEFVIIAAGKTGRPNVDWCETNRPETLRANVIGTLNVVDCCYLRKIHVTNFATGCLYHYSDAHPVDGKPVTEEDPPDFFGSFYSVTKGYMDSMLLAYDNVCTLRLRMPISDDLSHRSLITKLSKYEKLINIPNSMTVLYDLLPISLDMTAKKCAGTYNFTNPGAISHNEVMELYKKYLDPSHTWANFTPEDQAKILKCGRSNTNLDVSKLLKLYPDVPEIHVAMEECFKRMVAAGVKPEPKQ
jgi:nucleoside-diphosphate-sugar epimerase